MVFPHGDEETRPHMVLFEKIEEAGYPTPHTFKGIDVDFQPYDLFHHTLVFDSR